MIADDAWIIQFVNPAFERITGYSELVGRHARILAGSAQDQTVYTHLLSALERGEAWSGLLSARKKDGAPYEVHALSSPVKDESGEIVNYINIRRDVTLERKLERELRQAQKMESIGTLAGGIAHDFNNILAVILGYGELALMEVREGAPLHQNLSYIMTAALRAKELVKQILTFTRRSEQKQQPVQITPIVKEALKLMRSSLPTTIEIRQEIEIAPEKGVILGDPRRSIRY